MNKKFFSHFIETMTFRIQPFWRTKSFQGAPNQDEKSQRFQDGIEILRGMGVNALQQFVLNFVN